MKSSPAPAPFPLRPPAAALVIILLLSSLFFLPARARAQDQKPEIGNQKSEIRQNRLAAEKSPYLLQHADNPVHWHPWGEEAFALAVKENKPVFLSIGYSTCHWCHVMEHESFEDSETADFLNKHFISIKVDREERPDVDRIYMNYQQAANGGGGWPLSVWMSADRIPFFSGTYFPKEAKLGQVAFLDMLARVNEAWTLHRDDIRKDGARILNTLSGIFTAPPSEADAKALTKELSPKGFEALAAAYDAEFGGFGDRPKFPQPAVLGFLLEYRASPSPDAAKPSPAGAIDMVAATLRHMARGGIHDHLGGGFHRYSVDDYWHVPHFEKMLYDQAQIASVCLDVFQITGDPFFKDVALGIFAYVERDLSHPEGAFYSAEDADSLDPAGVRKEKTEGAFYLWTAAEIEAVLGKENAAVFAAAYDVKPDGNAPAGSDPFKEFVGKNILFRRKDTAELAAAFGKTAPEIDGILSAGRAALFATRAGRPRPHLDDKVLTAWNALMVSAYAKAHVILSSPARPGSESSAASAPSAIKSSYLDRAVAAATFLKNNLYDSAKRELRCSFREGPSPIHGTAEDYAYFVQALLDLYEASLDTGWLAFALELQGRQFDLLHDDTHGGFYDSPATQTDLILRLKNGSDGAIPSANSVSAANLVRLSALFKSDRFDSALDKLFKNFARDLATDPVGHAALLTALDRRLASPAQIVAVGKLDDPGTAAILAHVRAKFRPNKVVVLLDGGPGSEFFAAQNDLFAAFEPIGGKSTLYLCRNYTCQKPTNDPKEIAAQLDGL